MVAASTSGRLPVFSTGHSVDVTRDEVSTVIAVAGTFERQDVGAVETALKEALRAAGGIVVDLRRCRHIDAAAMMLLVSYKLALGVHLQIVVLPTGSVRRILEISGLARKLGVTSEPERARVALVAAC